MTVESPEARDARIDVGAVLGAVVQRLPRIILVTLVLLAATFALLMFMPRLYESSASILVEPRGNALSRATNEQAPSLSGGEAGVVSSQIELLKSRDTLLPVIDRLDLRSVPEFNGAGGGFSPMAIVGQLLGRKPAQASIDEIVLNNLYDRLTVIQERDSRIISVLVRSTDPQRAADIANAIAEAHVARRAGLSLADTAEASGWLGEEVARLRAEVTEAETAVANFRVDNDLFVGTNNTSLLDQQLSAIATQITAAQERKNTALSRAALIRGMIERGQPIEGIADVGDSAVIQQLSQEKARLQGEKAQRSATLLANHPTIRALTAQIAELDNQINIEAQRVADAIEAEAQIEADLEASLRTELARTKTSASTATQDNVTLDSLEREAKAKRDLLESYLLRYGEATSRTEVNSALPDVRVISVAAPAVAPASPKTQLILLAVGIVSLAVQIGLVVFGELMSGRAIVPVEAMASEPQRPQDQLDEMPFVEAELEPDQLWEEPEVEIAAVEPEGEGIAPELVAEPERIEPTIAEPTPAAAYEEQAPAAGRPRLPGALDMGQLTADLVMGHTHLVVLAGSGTQADCEGLADDLVADALAQGLSVALVDAGSGRPSEEPGLSDLSFEAASFGDVVHKSADNSFAEVPWGQERAINRRSTRPLTLVEALGDIYEVVVLMTGRLEAGSTLPMFESLGGRLVLVAGRDEDADEIAATRDQLLDVGFPTVEIAAAPTRVAA